MNGGEKLGLHKLKCNIQTGFKRYSMTSDDINNMTENPIKDLD